MSRPALWRSAITLLFVAVLIPPGLWLNRRIQLARDVAYFRSFSDRGVEIETRSEIDKAVLQHWLPDAVEPWVLPLFESPDYLALRTDMPFPVENASPTLDLQRVGGLTTLTVLSLEAAYTRVRELSQPDVRPANELDSAFLRSLPRLKRLAILNVRLKKSRLPLIAKLSRLETLNLTHTDMTDVDLAVLREMSQLKSLTLESNPVSDLGAASFVGLVNLEQLNLRDTKTTRLSIPHLAGLKRLRVLSLPDDLELTDDDLAVLSQFPLKYLKINSSHVTARGFRHVGRMTNLETLIIQKTTVSAADLAPLSSLKLGKLILPPNQRLGGSLKHFTGLRIEDCIIPLEILTDADIPPLIAMKSQGFYPELNLSESRVTDAGLAALEGVPKFFQVNLSQTRVTDAGLAPLATMPDLSMLFLRRTGITDRGLKTISQNQALEWLVLSETSVTDAGMVHLANLNGLILLEIDKTPVSDTGLRALAGLERLFSLNLEETQITDAGLECLAGMSQLLRLNLSGTSVTDAGLNHLLKCPRLQRLTLRHTSVTDTGLLKLAGLHHLSSLDVEQTSVTAEGLENFKRRQSELTNHQNAAP